MSHAKKIHSSNTFQRSNRDSSAVSGSKGPCHGGSGYNRRCSVASLNGTYAFRRTGVNNVLGGPIAQIGIEVFNGDGTRGSIRTTRSSNGDIRDWTDESPSGSYTVDPDCTGSFFDADGTKTHNLIVLGKGKGYFLLSVAPDTITTQEGEKIEGERLEVEH